jgi:fatty acid/phospholipid synthesis protein PlsX
MAKKIVIAVDAMGGDNAPYEIVKGAVLSANKNVKIILVGKKKLIENEIDNCDISNIEILDAQDVITNDDSPTWAIKNKKESSLIKALDLVKNDDANGFISAGSTGAILTCSTILLKRISGISRPAIATPLPNINGISLLLDSGANVDCKPIYLEQFAKMGSVYMENVMKIKNPRVGLLNIGTESKKGNAMTKEAYELLGGANINFIGNIEARSIPSGIADVIVCDGFSGNIILKHTEGLGENIFKMLKSELNKNIIRKLGAFLAKPAFMNIKKKFDYSDIGGAPFLGLNSIVVKAHGSSNSIAIKNSIVQCISFIENDIVEKIKTFTNETN